MIPAGMVMVGWPCILGSSKFSAKDDVLEGKGKFCLILKLGLWSLAMETDEIEDRPVSEMIDLCLIPPVVTTVTEMPPLLFM